MEMALLVLFIQDSNIFLPPLCCFAADLQQQTLPPPLLPVGAADIMEPGCSSSSPPGCSSSTCSSTGESSKAQAVSFTVGFNEPAKNPKKMPKRIAATRNKRRQELSEATIEEKQKLAEKRRKVSGLWANSNKLANELQTSLNWL